MEKIGSSGSDCNFERPASEKEKNLVNEYVDGLGVDHEKVAHSVFITEKEVADENGQVIGTEPVVRGAWIKSPAKKNEAAYSIEKAEPATVVPTRFRIKNRNRKSDRVALVIPDIQLGYRRIDDELQPIHDLQALEVAHMLARYIQPDEIIFNGDNLDLPNLSKHENDPAAMGTLNYSLQKLHNDLAQFRADAPNSKMVYLAGNHEDRLQRYLRKSAPELVGVRRAGVEGELGRHALSISELISAPVIDVEVIESYPAGKYFLNDRLKVVHGKEVESSGRMTASKVLKKDPFSSTIFGHIHRIEQAHRTIEDGRKGARQVSAFSFGTLARIDGGVPSTNWSRDARDAPAVSYENWQQGVGVVEYREGDHPFQAIAIPIHTHDDYVALFDGKEFKPQK